jgi:hypothetical protein
VTLLEEDVKRLRAEHTERLTAMGEAVDRVRNELASESAERDRAVDQLKEAIRDLAIGDLHLAWVGLVRPLRKYRGWILKTTRRVVGGFMVRGRWTIVTDSDLAGGSCCRAPRSVVPDELAFQPLGKTLVKQDAHGRGAPPWPAPGPRRPALW